MPTIEERALALVNEVKGCEKWETVKVHDLVPAEALFASIETLDAERAARAAFRQEVSDAVNGFARYCTVTDTPFPTDLSRFIIPEPVDPLLHLAREMALLDGVVRTDSQKAAIREGRAANTAADDFYDRLRTALPARGLKLVEVGDAD